MSTLIIYFAVPTKEQLGSSSKVRLLLTLSLNDQPKRGPDFANNANHKQTRMQKKLKSQTPVVSNSIDLNALTAHQGYWSCAE